LGRKLSSLTWRGIRVRIRVRVRVRVRVIISDLERKPLKEEILLLVSLKKNKVKVNLSASEGCRLACGVWGLFFYESLTLDLFLILI